MTEISQGYLSFGQNAAPKPFNIPVATVAEARHPPIYEDSEMVPRGNTSREGSGRAARIEADAVEIVNKPLRSSIV